jgi:hypothetical protein
MAVYVLLLLVFLAIADWSLHRSNSMSAQDTELVYCLAPAHLGGLVNAAEALDLAGQGSTQSVLLIGSDRLSIQQWHSADDADFLRACDAYSAANMSAPPAAEPAENALQTVADVLLPVIAGALLTMAADDFKQAADRRWTQASELRAAWQEFEQAAIAFAELCARALPDGLPSVGDVDDKRRKLQATVQKLRVQYHGRSKIRVLQRPLELDPLGPSMRGGWDTDHAMKRKRAQLIKERLDTYGASVEDVASTLERKIWLPSKR